MKGCLSGSILKTTQSRYFHYYPSSSVLVTEIRADEVQPLAHISSLLLTGVILFI